MRVYIPAHVDDLASANHGSWQPVTAFCVTDLLREAAPAADDEELAEIARAAAAEFSLTQLKSPLRAVVVADVLRDEVEPDSGTHPAAVTLTTRVPSGVVACAFVDEPDAADDVVKAVLGDEAAWDRLDERELLWFDASELDAPLAT